MYVHAKKIAAINEKNIANCYVKKYPFPPHSIRSAKDVIYAL